MTSDSSTPLTRHTWGNISVGFLPWDEANIIVDLHMLAYLRGNSMRPGNSGSQDLAALAIRSSRNGEGLDLIKGEIFIIYLN